MSWHRNYAKLCEKKSQNRRNQGFSYYFCLMFEGSRSGSGSGSGSIPLTNGSGSGSRRPKNTWIQGIWIRIRIRIRIRNTSVMSILNFLGHKYSEVRNYEFFDIVITNLRVKMTLRNYDVITRFRNYVTTLGWNKQYCDSATVLSGRLHFLGGLASLLIRVNASWRKYWKHSQ